MPDASAVIPENDRTTGCPAVADDEPSATLTVEACNSGCPDAASLP